MSFDAIHAELNYCKQRPHIYSHQMLDEIMADCPDGECMRCAQIICPHEDGMHFHHDGCPSCADAENTQSTGL